MRTYVNWRTRIRVWCFEASIVDGVVEEWPEAFVRVLMRPNLQVDAVLVKELLEAVLVNEWQADAHSIVELGAVVLIRVSAVHRPMSHRYDPLKISS